MAKTKVMCSDNFTKKEMTVTNTDLYNEPCQAEFMNLLDLCQEILEPIRLLLASKLKILSGYRSFEVNKEVGGVKTSQHLNGHAADFIPIGMNLSRAYELIKSSNIKYDQLILEPGWIHVSYSTKPRLQAFVK